MKQQRLCVILFTCKETSKGKEVLFPCACFCTYGFVGEQNDFSTLVSPAWCGMWSQSDETPVSLLQNSLLLCLQIGNAAYSWVSSCGHLIYVHSPGGKKKKSSSYLNIQHSSMFAGVIFQVISLSNLDKNMYFSTKDKAHVLIPDTE